MPLPGAVGTCTLSGKCAMLPGAAANAGSISFTVPGPLYDTTDHVMLAAGSYVAPLAPDGSFSVALPYNDNPGVSPTGWSYLVTENIAGGRPPYYIQVSRSLGPTASLDQLAQSPVPAGPVIPNLWIPVTLVQAKGDLVAGSGAGVVVRLPVGADGTVLTASSGAAGGVVWAASSGGPAGPAGGDLGGFFPDPDVEKINGVAVPAAPAIGAVPAATSATAASWVSILNAGPWVFDVRAYGAVGDGQVVTDGSITTGTSIFTSPSAPFHPSDVGKAFMIKGALASGTTTLVTTITGYTSASQVTLGANATATVSGNGMALWATDDTTAIQDTINAAFAHGQQQGLGVIWFPPAAGLFYGVAGPLVAGGATKANGQLVIPVQATTANKVTLVFRGATDGGATRHWQQKTPVLTGSTIVSFGAFPNATAQVNSLTANGNPACISGQTGANGYGTSALLYNNVLVRMQGVQVYTTHSASGWGYGALNFHGLAAAALVDFGYGTCGTYAAGDFFDSDSFSAGLSIGVLMPSAGNNDCNVMRNVLCHGGYTRAVFATEHTDWLGGTVLYCWSGICPVGNYGDGGSGVGASHGVNLSQISIEGCSNLLEIIGPGQAGIGPMISGSVDTEGASTIRDNSAGLAAACGTLHLKGNGGSSPSIGANTPLQVICEFQFPGPVASPPALPPGTAVQNPFGRWANVTLQGGTVTSVQLGALMGGASAPPMTTVFSQSSGAMPLHTVRVPPLGWIQVNGGATPTTNTWVLE